MLLGQTSGTGRSSGDQGRHSSCWRAASRNEAVGLIGQEGCSDVPKRDRQYSNAASATLGMPNPWEECRMHLGRRLGNLRMERKMLLIISSAFLQMGGGGKKNWAI